MQLTITEPDRMATAAGVDTFDRFCSWLVANQVNPNQINGNENITVTSVMISGTTVMQTTFAQDVTVPMPADLAQILESVYHPSERLAAPDHKHLGSVLWYARVNATGDDAQEIAPGVMRAEAIAAAIHANVVQGGFSDVFTEANRLSRDRRGVAPTAPEEGGYRTAAALPETSDAENGADPETPLDDMAHLVKQLQDARAEGKAAKEKEDEARDQILARLRERGGEYGTVAGQRVIRAKEVISNRFLTVQFKKDHPEMAQQYTGESKSIRLETL